MQTPTLPYDRAAALDNLGGDEALLRQIAELFVADWPQGRERLLASLAAGDAAAAGREAHAIKGSVANFCAERAVAAMRAVELAGKAGDLAQARALAGDAVAAVEEVAATLLQRERA